MDRTTHTSSSIQLLHLAVTEPPSAACARNPLPLPVIPTRDLEQQPGRLLLSILLFPAAGSSFARIRAVLSSFCSTHPGRCACREPCIIPDKGCAQLTAPLLNCRQRRAPVPFSSHPVLTTPSLSSCLSQTVQRTAPLLFQQEARLQVQLRGCFGSVASTKYGLPSTATAAAAQTATIPRLHRIR